MNIFAKLLENSIDYRELKAALEQKRAASISGVAQVQKAHLCFSLCQKRPLLFVAADEAEASRMLETLNAFYGEGVCYFPQNDYCFDDLLGASREWEHQRIAALRALKNGDASAVVATADSLCRRTLSPDEMQKNIRELTLGDLAPVEDILAYLTENGYSASALVEGPGQFARRGGIVDFFPPDSENPYRIELFGDEIDSVGLFDVVSQRRIETVSKARLTPAKEHIADLRLAEKIRQLQSRVQKRQGEAAKSAAQKLARDLEALENGLPPSSPDRYLNLYSDKVYTLFDFLPENCLVAVSETAAVTARLRGFDSLMKEEIKNALKNGSLTKELAENLYLSPGEFWGRAARFSLLFADALAKSRFPVPVSHICPPIGRSAPPAAAGAEAFKAELTNYRAEGYDIYILCSSEKKAANMAALLTDFGLPAARVENGAAPQKGLIGVYAQHLPAGVVYPEIGAALLTDGSGAAGKPRRKKPPAKERVKTYSDLAPGDLVVHTAYGIGRYAGIEKLTVEGVIRDYVKIQYAGSDVLYVPANQLDFLSKYVGAADGAKVRLNKMGGAEWQKTKLRVKQSVAEMAEKLISLYAERAASLGHRFCRDTDMQDEFESRFDYEETADQLRCVEEIKRDMESPRPMDRLLCGDVGFGKTEVALRAAFKCVADSRQCAILVPTTILAWQHYNTMLRRFAGFPVKIEILSRFRTAAQQQQIIKKLKSGGCDIVVGTHRLLQKDVGFKALGLVIIDEEQRFGVAHKEKLKELTKNVDCLTLTATPIPRTLNMALSGVRDMSLIEEPPQDRLPVQTYVVEYDRGLITEAIRRELRRGGQVFYLHNRVDSIMHCASRLKAALPDARIAVGHGKMSETELADVWQQIVDREADILVCTTIIETGVDVPNANTLIIEDADRLGLAQLYQLRGRVGRSSRRAYVYFTYKKGRVLTEEATKRLTAIREFTEFNSGYKIAMRDLEIRGAGNLLGASQHGHMEAVGYDMYVKLLEEEVAKKKGEAPKKQTDCAVDLFVSAYIPEEYIDRAEQRIDMYKKIAAVRNGEDLADLYDELVDRYGDIPKPVETLCRISIARAKAGALGISSVEHKGRLLRIDAAALPLKTITEFIDAAGGKNVMFEAGNNPALSFRLKAGDDPLKSLERAVDILEKLEAGG